MVSAAHALACVVDINFNPRTEGVRNGAAGPSAAGRAVAHCGRNTSLAHMLDRLLIIKEVI